MRHSVGWEFGNLYLYHVPPGDSYNQASLGNTELQSSKIIVRIKWENKALFSLLLLLSCIACLLLWDTMLAALCSLWLNETNLIVSISQRKKLSFRERKWLPLGHTAGAWLKPGWVQSLNSPFPAIKKVQFMFFFPFRINSTFKSAIGISDSSTNSHTHSPGLLIKYLLSTYLGETLCQAGNMQLWTCSVEFSEGAR